eukprot:scaffold126938_cov60-Phaeocystis_antarctica.AAC.2
MSCSERASHAAFADASSAKLMSGAPPGRRWPPARCADTPRCGASTYPATGGPAMSQSMVATRRGHRLSSRV